MSAITSVEVIAAGPRMPAVRFTDALPAVHTTVTFVLITTEDGGLGVGAVESDSFGSFDLGPLEALRSVVPPLLGRDGLQPSALATLAASRLPSASRHVPVSAIEVASWDLMGRHAGLPLHRLLGGARDEVAAYASLPFEPAPETLLALLAQVEASGYRAAKLHLSGDPVTDVEAVTRA